MDEHTENATKATALREAAADFRSNASRAWGGDAGWMTTGTRVASLAAGWLEELAEDIEAGL